MADCPERWLLRIGAALGVEPADCDDAPAACWSRYAAEILAVASTVGRLGHRRSVAGRRRPVTACPRAPGNRPTAAAQARLALERAAAVLGALTCECTEEHACSLHRDRRLVAQALAALKRDGERPG